MTERIEQSLYSTDGLFGALGWMRGKQVESRFIIPALCMVPEHLLNLNSSHIIQEANNRLGAARQELHSSISVLFPEEAQEKGIDYLLSDIASDLEFKGRVLFDPHPPKLSFEEVQKMRETSLAHNVSNRLFSQLDACGEDNEAQRIQALTFAHLGMELALRLLKQYNGLYGQRGDGFAWLSEVAKTFAYLELLAAGTVNTTASAVMNTQWNMFNLNAVTNEDFEELFRNISPMPKQSFPQ